MVKPMESNMEIQAIVNGDIANKSPVRNAEKTRPFSTCDFADRVFDSVVNKLTNLSPRFLEKMKRKSGDKDGSDAFCDKFSTFNELFGDTQTVCAGIVSYDSVTDKLETVAIGVGTKFIENDTNTESMLVSKRGIQNR